MYKQVETHKEARIAERNIYQPKLSIIHPVATLEDEYGGRAHWGIDDSCYVLYQEHHEENEAEAQCSPVTHIFNEALEILKTLPD